MRARLVKVDDATGGVDQAQVQSEEITRVANNDSWL